MTSSLSKLIQLFDTVTRELKENCTSFTLFHFIRLIGSWKSTRLCPTYGSGYLSQNSLLSVNHSGFHHHPSDLNN